MRFIRKILAGMLIAVVLLSCAACSGLDTLSDNLKGGVKQLGDDVAIGKSNAIITPYHSFEGKRTADNAAMILHLILGLVSLSIFPRIWRKQCLLKMRMVVLLFDFNQVQITSASMVMTILVLSRLQ